MLIDRQEFERRVDEAFATRRARIGFALSLLVLVSLSSFGAGMALMHLKHDELMLDQRFADRAD